MSREEHKGAIEVSAIFHEGQRMFAVPKQPAQQAHRVVCESESYDMIDRFLRNNLYDDDYESYSEALHEVATSPQPAQRTWVGLTEPERLACYDLNPARFASAIEAKLKEKNT